MNISTTIFCYYAYETTKKILYWSGGQLFYIVTPKIIYNFINPQKSESQQLVKEIRELKQEIRNLKNNEVETQTFIYLDSTSTEIKSIAVEL